MSLAAGILEVEASDLAVWISHSETLKPEVEMPSYDHLSADDLSALVSYLGGLK